MFLAQEAAKTINFTGFDIFVILFTLIIGIGLFRLLKQPVKNPFAIGFAAVCFIVFLLMDVLMVMNWLGVLTNVEG
jgi:hypothetical protein